MFIEDVEVEHTGFCIMDFSEDNKVKFYLKYLSKLEGKSIQIVLDESKIVKSFCYKARGEIGIIFHESQSQNILLSFEIKKLDDKTSKYLRKKLTAYRSDQNFPCFSTYFSKSKTKTKHDNSKKLMYCNSLIKKGRCVKIDISCMVDSYVRQQAALLEAYKNFLEEFHYGKSETRKVLMGKEEFFTFYGDLTTIMVSGEMLGYQCKLYLHIKRCRSCYKNCLLKCSSCRSEYYCNAICQENDWNEHKNNCSSLKQGYDLIHGDGLAQRIQNYYENIHKKTLVDFHSFRKYCHHKLIQEYYKIKFELD